MWKSYKSSAVAEMGDRGYNRHGPKRGGGCCAPFAGSWDPRLIQCGLGQDPFPYQVASSSIHPFGHNRHIQPFGHNGHWPKIGGCAPLGEGELGPHLTQCRVGRSLPLYQVASWSMQPFGHNRRGPKIGGSAPFWGGAGSTSNTKSPGLRPTSVPSGILTHTTVWPK